MEENNNIKKMARINKKNFVVIIKVAEIRTLP